MKTLSYGSSGPQVQLLQLALFRAGYGNIASDGVFGQQTLGALKRFQRRIGLSADGIAGPATHRALHPYYTGYVNHMIRAGDSFYRLARQYGSSVAAIAAANPSLDPLRLPLGQTASVPLSFDVVPTRISYCSELVRFCCEGIAALGLEPNWQSLGDEGIMVASKGPALVLAGGRRGVLYALYDSTMTYSLIH